MHKLLLLCITSIFCNRKVVTLQTIGLKFQVVEAALLSRIQRLERRLMDLEPRVSMEHSEYFFIFLLLFYSILLFPFLETYCGTIFGRPFIMS